MTLSSRSNHVRLCWHNLALFFDRLRLTRTKLNLDKCVFRVTTGKLFSFIVSYQEIEANLEKIRAIEAMRPPTRIKDMQRLMGCLVTLSHSSRFCGNPDVPSGPRM
jgi:hypothetical protein